MKDQVTNVLRLASLVRENVRKKQLFTPYKPVLITLSGGQDSLCSLLLLYLLQDQLGLTRAVISRHGEETVGPYSPASRSHSARVESKRVDNMVDLLAPTTRLPVSYRGAVGSRVVQPRRINKCLSRTAGGRRRAVARRLTFVRGLRIGRLPAWSQARRAQSLYGLTPALRSLVRRTHHWRFASIGLTGQLSQALQAYRCFAPVLAFGEQGPEGLFASANPCVRAGARSLALRSHSRFALTGASRLLPLRASPHWLYGHTGPTGQPSLALCAQSCKALTGASHPCSPSASKARSAQSSERLTRSKDSLVLRTSANSRFARVRARACQIKGLAHGLALCANRPYGPCSSKVSTRPPKVGNRCGCASCSSWAMALVAGCRPATRLGPYRARATGTGTLFRRSSEQRNRPVPNLRFGVLAKGEQPARFVPATSMSKSMLYGRRSCSASLSSEFGHLGVELVMKSARPRWRPGWHNRPLGPSFLLAPGLIERDGTPDHAIDNRPSFGECTQKVCKIGVTPYSSFTGRDKTLPDWVACLPKVSTRFNASYRRIEQFGMLWCNHFWQKESFHTMLHVAKLNLCFFSPMCFFLPIDSILCEQNARDWRHKSIQRTCAFFHYECCTQGHTKSDRVETILFNLLRGTGVAGLQMLQWKKSFYSFSCQRFYPRLLFLKLKWAHPSAPLLKRTQGLYKIGYYSKFCLVNIGTEPVFKLSTRSFY